MDRSNGQSGQTVIILVLALALFVVGAVGLTVDGAHLYTEVQKAQVAADSAATAAAVSMLQGTTGSVPPEFSTAAAFDCSIGDARVPCKYAAMNGFGTADDTVHVDFPDCDGCGYADKLSSHDSPNQVRVTIQRNVKNSFIRMLGALASTPIKATATAGILEVQTPAPIIITHPTYDDTLSVNSSNYQIVICGGPSRSIQVNSSSLSAFTGGGGIDLRLAGKPTDPANPCSGTGGNFGVFGGVSSKPSGLELGNGKYEQPASPMSDPFRDVAPPPVPSSIAPAPVPIAKGEHGCNYVSGCLFVKPGLYNGPSGFKPNKNPSSQPMIFAPGVYYVQSKGGVDFRGVIGGGGPPDYNAMCTDCIADANTGMGMLIYNTGPAGSTPGNDPAGNFNIGAPEPDFSIVGPTPTEPNSDGYQVPAGPYYNILFWQDRDADAQHGGSREHSLGNGTGCFSLIGTIYMTNWLQTMKDDPEHYQSVTYNGNPCSSTYNKGFVVASELHLVGLSQLYMSITPYKYRDLRQVALVSGGAHP